MSSFQPVENSDSPVVGSDIDSDNALFRNIQDELGNEFHEVFMRRPDVSISGVAINDCFGSIQLTDSGSDSKSDDSSASKKEPYDGPLPEGSYVRPEVSERFMESRKPYDGPMPKGSFFPVEEQESIDDGNADSAETYLRDLSDAETKGDTGFRQASAELNPVSELVERQLEENQRPDITRHMDGSATSRFEDGAIIYSDNSDGSTTYIDPVGKFVTRMKDGSVVTGIVTSDTMNDPNFKGEPADPHQIFQSRIVDGRMDFESSTDPVTGNVTVKFIDGSVLQNSNIDGSQVYTDSKGNVSRREGR